MKGNGGQVEPEQCHVLDNKRIHACVVKVVNHRLNSFQLMVIDDGVDSAIDASVILMGKVNKTFNGLDVVACLRPCPKCAGTNVYRIGTVLDGLDAYFFVLGWSKKFYGALFGVHDS